ncbi:MAG TPA: Fe-S cluster assembly protein SufD [Frankiaceae bacterium]|nr:Fe-S cluster assembly protein SufD [Frankiaceae bacterium]
MAEVSREVAGREVAGQVSVAPGEPAPPGPFMGGTGAPVPQVAPHPLAPHAHGGGQPRDARPRRVRSRDPEAFPTPTGREEEWRFTPLRRLRGLLDGPEPDAKLDVTVQAPAAVTVERVGSGDPRIGAVLTPADRVSAYAMARADGAVVVGVPREAQVAEPVVLRLRGEGGTAYGHLVVEVAPFAAATVVLDHVGGATYAGNAELVVGDGASLTVVSLQDWDPGAVHVAAHAARVGRDARFRSFTVTLGGDLVRLSPTVTYAGSGGDAELYGLFFTDAGQHQEHRIFVDHGQRACRSRVTYKGALQGEGAHAVWIGDVLIRHGAVGTDTYELNRNLVLSDGARADSVPNLEIETGEVVGAGHASATGRFDDDQLFYLMARGIPAAQARRLVVRGFFAEVVERIDVPSLRERIVQAVEDELAAVGA